MSLKLRRHSFVSDIEDVLLSDKTTICDLQGWLMEWFVDIEAHSVAGSVLVGVLVLLSLPAFTVPQLSVAFIAGRVRVRSLGNDKLCTILEGAVRISASEVRSVVNLWALEACSGSGCEVVDRLVVGSSVHHGPCAVTAGGSVE